MSGSLDVRKFLQQQDEAISRQGSGGVPAQRTGEPTRISADQVHRARIAVATGALDAEDCRQLLEMLGLVPDENGTPPVRQ
jgi:hypothetical protein